MIQKILWKLYSEINDEFLENVSSLEDLDSKIFKMLKTQNININQYTNVDLDLEDIPSYLLNSQMIKSQMANNKIIIPFKFLSICQELALLDIEKYEIIYAKFMEILDYWGYQFTNNCDELIIFNFFKLKSLYDKEIGPLNFYCYIAEKLIVSTSIKNLGIFCCVLHILSKSVENQIFLYENTYCMLKYIFISNTYFCEYIIRLEAPPYKIYHNLIKECLNIIKLKKLIFIICIFNKDVYNFHLDRGIEYLTEKNNEISLSLFNINRDTLFADKIISNKNNVYLQELYVYILSSLISRFPIRINTVSFENMYNIIYYNIVNRFVQNSNQIDRENCMKFIIEFIDENCITELSNFVSVDKRKEEYLSYIQNTRGDRRNELEYTYFNKAGILANKFILFVNFLIADNNLIYFLNREYLWNKITTDDYIRELKNANGDNIPCSCDHKDKVRYQVIILKMLSDRYDIFENDCLSLKENIQKNTSFFHFKPEI